MMLCLMIHVNIGDFDLSDQERLGQPPKFEDGELQELLDKDSTQTQKELAAQL